MSFLGVTPASRRPTERDIFLLAALVSLALITACSSEPEHKAPVKPPEPVTGLHALVAMYGKARQWAPDVKVLRYQSIEIAQVKSQPGKAPAWQVIFGSESLGKKRTYTYSVFDASTTLRKGIFEDAPGSWSNDNRAILMSALQTDTDQAWETALKHGKEYAEKNPNVPVTWTLEMGRLVGTPVWRVIWGESATVSAYSILIDADSGRYLETLH